MAIIGIVGGLGPEGTVHYYTQLSRALASMPLDAGRPGIVVDHVWIDRFVALLRSGATEEIVSLLASSLERVRRAGADVALVAAVTPHKFLPALRRASPIPIVDLVQATQDEIVAAGHRTVGLLGTRATMTERFFRGGLERAGIEVFVPQENAIAYLDDLIFGPLVSGATSAMKDEMRAIVDEMGTRTRLDALVVACTDLMNLVRTGLPVVDAVECHVRAAVDALRATR